MVEFEEDSKLFLGEWRGRGCPLGDKFEIVFGQSEEKRVS